MSTFRKIIFSLFVSIFVLIAFEFLVGSLYSAELIAWESPPPPAKSGAPTLKGNPYLLFEFAPGVRREQNVTVTINRLGLRGEEIEIPKPDGIRRFITTGDSSVFGFGVEDAEVFSKVADELLGYKAQSICGAIPGYSSFQSINLLHLRGLSTEPDLFVIGNIWSDNNFDSFIDKELLATYTGYEQSMVGVTKKFLSQFNLYRVIDWKMRVKKRAQVARKVGWTLGSSEHIGARRVEINDYAQNLETMVQMAKEMNAEVLFMLLANEEDLRSISGDKAWTPYRDIMKSTAKRHGAPLIHVPELFMASALSKEELFLDEMHPTRKGHKIMAEALSKILQDADWVNGGKIMTDGDGSSLPMYEDPFIKGASTSSGGLFGASQTTTQGLKITGDIVYQNYASGIIHIDVLNATQRDANVVNIAKIQKPGPFSIPVGQVGKVKLRVYIDTAGDGPDAKDQLIDLTKTTLHLDQNPDQMITIDLDRKQISAR